MIENGFYAKLAQLGLSVIPISDDKIPIGAWKDYQEKHRTEEEVLQSKFNKWGLVTGYKDLECIDVDLKVFSTTKEKIDFWDELIGLLQDSIFDFDEKFVIYKTQNAGYHILYKSKRVQGNQKISKLKDHKECVIETRGKSGMVVIYKDKKISKKSYFDIQYISDDDRENLMRICKSFNYQEPKIDVIKPVIKKEYLSDGCTPWDDFNNKNNVWNVISDDFTIIRDAQKRIFIKRHGAKSIHSGYIYKDDNLMYLHSTGTIYPNETQLSPYACYTWKYHNGDFKESTKDLYEQGFGSRLSKKIDELKPIIPEKIEIETPEFPIDIFPKDIQFYISECASKLDSNIDYMGVSLMWLISVCVGNSFEIEVKRGWNENGVIWVAVVGKAGIGKTPSINNIIHPLMKVNSKEIKNYIKQLDEFNFYNSLSKKEKEDYPEVLEPKKTQFIANDITLEALVELHQESDNAVGVFKDELAGWFKDMNKYRAGSDLEFWLSCWSGKSVSMNRKTAKSSFVEKPFIPVLGGIQPAIFNSMSTEENKDNGFMDRMLLSFPESRVEHYNDSELDYSTIKWYSETIKKFYDTMLNLVKRNDQREIEPSLCKFTEEAKIEWIRIFNNITNSQNNDDENEYLKSMFPKQKSYIPRFALLIHLFDNVFVDGISPYEISKDSILKAEKLSDYFVINAKKIKVESKEVEELKETSKNINNTHEKVVAIYKKDPDFNRSKVAELLGVSRKTVQQYVKKIQENEK